MTLYIALCRVSRLSTLGRCCLWLAVATALASLSSRSRARAENEIDESSQVAVVFNRSMDESEAVARHYAERRGIPADNLFGLKLPESEAISRSDYEKRLEKPLRKALEKFGLMEVFDEKTTDRNGALATGKIRYLVLCYGVPSKIEEDSRHREDGSEEFPPELRVNRASVDSELSVLPRRERESRLVGPLQNFLYASTNRTELTPANGLLMVARLDGPTAAIARGLVDKAIEAETNGLWGRAYFDLRGMTDGPYKIGDDWLRGAHKIVRRMGWETYLDEAPTTLPVEYPLDRVGLYAGWYSDSGRVNGPFTRDSVDFMPGAIAYHLHSFSAQQIRTSDNYWVGPLLAKGAAATMGFVHEPYLQFTPDMTAFFARIIALGFSFGEAAYTAQQALSWQTTVIGDPLYRPYRKPPGQLHQELEARGDSRLEWSHMRIVNLNFVTQFPVPKLIDHLQKTPVAATSPVLQEKLGWLHFLEGDSEAQMAAWDRALSMGPTSNQKVRLLLELASVFEQSNRPDEAVNALQRLIREVPDYPAAAALQQRIQRLSSPAPKP